MPHLRAAHMLAIAFAAMVATSACSTRAFPDDLPPPSEPMLAERGDWAADFNQAQITCFNGSMTACDAIWLSKRVLMDTGAASARGGQTNAVKPRVGVARTDLARIWAVCTPTKGAGDGTGEIVQLSSPDPPRFCGSDIPSGR